MPPCTFEFCWLCLGAWSEHRVGRGLCNRYGTAQQKGTDGSEREREMAKNSLKRYNHYYERWATNESSRVKALSDLQQMQAVQIEKLRDTLGQPRVSGLMSVIEAWLQIVECRRVLKWTYAYGYFLPEHEHCKRQLFECLQGQAEHHLERLHICAEKELQGFIDGESPAKDFNDFCSKLVNLTKVTGTYFENLLQALEKGLSDVTNGQARVEASSSEASPISKRRRRFKLVASNNS